VPNPDIIEAVAASRPSVLRRLRGRKRKPGAERGNQAPRKKLPLLAANLAQAAIGADDNELVLFDDDGFTGWREHRNLSWHAP